MKILHVETGRHFYGGAQQVVYLIGGLAAAGVDNVLVCPPGSDIDGAIRGRNANGPNVNGPNVNGPNLNILNLACAGDLDLTFAWRLRKVLLRERPDLLHCHSRRGADFLGGLAAALTRVPAVVSRRVDHPEPDFLARWRYRPFRKVIAISDNVAAVLQANGLDAARLIVIRSAVDTERFQRPWSREALRREFGIADREFAIAAVGQLIPRKGYRYLLDAMARLERQRPGIRLVVFGRGRQEAELKVRAAQLNLGAVVQFAGFRGDLDDYLGSFDLVAHPALREGLGVAMLKAAAAGVPVVAFDVAGSREAVADGKTGILATPKSDVSFANAILRLAEDPLRRKKYAEAGRQRMHDEFSIEAMTKRHLQLYASVLHDPRHDP